jgi:hypothetical protein
MKRICRRTALAALGLSLVSLYLSGCHHRSKGEVMMTGYSAPEYRNKTLTSVFVKARVSNSYFRDQVEKRLAHAIDAQSSKSVHVVMDLDMFPPIREYAESEIERRLSSEHFDAVLFVNVSGSDVAVATGWGFSGNKYGASGGSYSTASRYTRVTAEMYDPANKHIMWKGEGSVEVRGSKKSSLNNTAELIATRIAVMMKDDGFY